MKVLDFLDFFLSGAFGLLAFLFYLFNKADVKTRREKGIYEGLTRVAIFKSWVIIIVLSIISLSYFFSFIKTFFK